MTEELKPCPFCVKGGNPSLWTTITETNKYRLYRVGCLYCFCEGPSFSEKLYRDAKAKAIKAWNTRSGESNE